MSSRRVLLAGAVGLLAGGGGLLAWGAGRSGTPGSAPVPTPAPSAPPSPVPPPFDLAQVDAAKLVSVTAEGWHSWALLDRQNGAIIGSENIAETNRACSMIKVWIAADYLRQKPSPTQSRLNDITIMIRDSDSVSADRLMNEIKRVPSFTRMRDMCGLTDFTPINSWSMAVVSARDMCKVGDAVAKAAIADPKWTDHLLGLMRNVNRGKWGIRDALPAEQQASLAIKNGWDTTMEQGTYHANCLAISERWVMCVLTRYSLKFSANEQHGAKVATSIASQLIQSPELQPLFS